MAYAPAVTHTIVGGDVMWDTDGYISLDGEQWQDITISATFTYNGGLIGLLPRFETDQAYVSFTIGNFDTNDSSIVAPTDSKAVAAIDALIIDQTYHLAKANLSPLTLGSSHKLSVTITGTNYKAYLDNVLIFNIEYSNLVTGTSALYSTTGNSCAIVEVLAPVADVWLSNIASINGATIQFKDLSNDDTYIYMLNPDATTPLLVRQEVTITAPAPALTLSYQYLGELTAKIIELNGAASGTQHSVDNDLVSSWTAQSLTATVDPGCTLVEVQFVVSTNTPTEINTIQLEENPFPTSYIENTSTVDPASRGASQITYPAVNNIFTDNGAVSMWIKPATDYTTTLSQHPVLFEFGGPTNFLRLHYDAGIVFTSGNSMATNNSITTLAKDTWYHIAACWTATDMSVTVNGVQQLQQGIFTASDVSNVISIGFSQYPNAVSGITLDTFNGVFDEFVIFSKSITLDDIKALYQAETASTKTDLMLIHSTFDYEIAGFDTSMMEISPAPLYGSPIIAAKDDGTIMNKVSYFDPNTGAYHPYNIEPVIYDGQSDYVTVGCKNIEAVKFKTLIKDSDGLQIGDPYTIVGDRIYHILTSYEKLKYKGQTLYVTYQPQDAYTVDFNIGVADSFRVSLGKHDGSGVSVTYEGDKFYVDKLADMVELNPLLAPQHDGFLYITQTGYPITNFRAKATPSDLPADGSSEAVVVIEPLDSLGNFVANANLSVTASKGSLIPNTDYGSVQMRISAGRYMYKYRSPLIKYSDVLLPELNESINVIDNDTGLGVQIPITLTLSDSYPNEGNVTLQQENWEHIASYILDKVMTNFGKKIADLPTGLGTLLDLDTSGTIDLGDIVWLNDYKLTDSLYQKYIALVQWYAQNS